MSDPIKWWAAMMEKAEKIETWDGWVWDGNHYFSSIDEYLDHCEFYHENPGDIPEFVFTCTERPFKGLDLGRILDNLCDGEYDGMIGDLRGIDSLNDAIDEFNAVNASIITYDGDFSRAVRVPRSEESANEP